MSTHPATLLLLDLGLPDIDGQEIICQLRSWSNVPIMVLSARNQESDITLALDTNQSVFNDPTNGQIYILL